MIPTVRVSALLLSLLLVHSSIAEPQPPPIIAPLFCSLCTLTTLPFPCASRGLEFAVQEHTYTNIYKLDENRTPVVTVDMSDFHNAPPYQSGFTKRIGTDTREPGEYNIYGGAPTHAAYKAINHRAYFLAPADGLYTLTVSSPDDAVFIWVGDNAYNGKYTSDNADLVLLLKRPKQSFKFKADAKIPIALRILFINAAGEARFGITMTDPAGKVIFGADAVADTPFFIPYTCDCSSPPFQPWGKETAAGSGSGCGLLGAITSNFL